MDTSGRIPWAVLGIPEDASIDDARRAFRGLVKGAHPDVGGDAVVFAALVDAFKAVAAQRALGTSHLTTPAPRPRPPTPYDWATRPTAPAPRVWGERPATRPPAARDVPRFADVLARELVRQGAAAA